MEQRSTIIKLLGVFLFFLLVACNSENANDCLQKAGPLVREEITVDAFDKILVNRDIELIVKEGAEQRVFIEKFL